MRKNFVKATCLYRDRLLGSDSKLCHPPTHRVMTVFAMLLAVWALPRPTLVYAQTGSASAGQSYPSKPVRFIVPGSAGTSDDFHARVVAPKLTELLGQQFIVEPRPGAGGLIAQTIVVNAPPDGYTILLTGRSITAARFLNANMKFDPQRALSPAALLLTYSFVLVVNPALNATSVNEYIALARQQPGKISVADTGGSMPTVAATIFGSMAKVDIFPVAYKSGSQIPVDLIAGRVDSYFAPITTYVPHISAGKLRALGVTGPKRSAALPNVPTIAEAGVPGYEAASWIFIAAPAGTPRTVIEKLNSAVMRTIAMPDVRESLMKVGSEPATSTVEDLTKRIADATAQFGRIAKELGIKPQ
jgi:tripartite-type tricarboxylate transporter receptor subunit TctC